MQGPIRRLKRRAGRRVPWLEGEAVPLCALGGKDLAP